MRRYWLIYIIVALIIGFIVMLTFRNEREYHDEVVKKQNVQAMRDSAVAQITRDVDTIKNHIGQLTERVGEIEEKMDTALTNQEKQLKSDNKQVRELRQIRRAVKKCNKKSEN